MVKVKLGMRVEARGLESERVRKVAGMFGLGVEGEREITVVPEGELELKAGQVVFITGPSGGGKSSILRMVRQAAGREGAVEVIEVGQGTKGPGD